MEGFRRYALYYAPPPGPLAEFGAAWLGWDAEAGRRVAHPALPGLPAPAAELTAQPHRYGLHATLKPPFRLARDFDVAELTNAAEALSASLPAVLIDGLELARIGDFLALVPVGDATALALLAARLVEALDLFRAPPDLEELERWREETLSPNQQALLARWGYPWVMEEFRFHITLTGPLDPDTAEAVAACLRPQLAPLLTRPWRIRDIALCGEGQDGRFRLLRRHSLSG